MNPKLVAHLLLALLLSTVAAAQQAAPTQHDPALDAASNLIGKALFLRCFCAENNLIFDEQGLPVGTVKTTDWTLAAVNIQKVERKGPGELELQGVRVAIRFATDRREFDRHPLNDDKVKIQRRPWRSGFLGARIERCLCGRP